MEQWRNLTANDGEGNDHGSDKADREIGIEYLGIEVF